jgi:ArsR family transcriptional regulator
MYFNQLAKEIGIGQQAILRHVKALEDIGLIESYSEKSNLGAPDRKYYRLNSSFSLTISLSEDAFSIDSHMIKESRHKESNKFYKNYDSLPKNDDGQGLKQLQSNLADIEKEIYNLDSQLNDLQALKQLILQRLHKICKDNFEEQFQRKVLHTVIEESPNSISELAYKVNERESHVRNTLNSMDKKLYGSKNRQKLFTKIRNKIIH